MNHSNSADAARGQKRKRTSEATHSTSRSHLPKNTGSEPPATNSHERKHAVSGTNGIARPAFQPHVKTAFSPANKRAALLKARQELPIFPHSSSIVSALTDTDVLLLSGETGSGKSTQLPQFLLDAPWCTGRIAVTQPRRMAAISLARRVADELGSPLGKNSPASRVGYSVRFDDNVGRAKTGVKYLTEGMLLQEMLRDPGLAEYSVVVVDEVHERSVNVDLILGFLRDLVVGRGAGAKKRKGRKLKIVVMSATADTEGLKRFFEDGFQEQGQSEKATNGIINGGPKNGTEAKNSGDAQSDESWSGLSDTEGEARNASNKAKSLGNPKGLSSDRVSMCFVKGRQYPVQTIYLPDPIQDFAEAALKCIFQVHCKEPMPGDILVFLTGQDTVQSLQKNVEEYAQGLTADYPKVSLASSTLFTEAELI